MAPGGWNRRPVLRPLEGAAMRVFVARLLALLHRRRLDDDLENEMASHLDFAIADNLSRGMTLDAARAAAARTFGDPLRVKEAYRARLGFPWLELLWSDTRSAGRLFRKAPGI